MASSIRDNTFYRPVAAALAALGAHAPALAGFVPPQPDKSEYTLFNPTPREAMRDMSTDRPDTTESPYTVDAGHVQLELSFIDSTLDRRSADGSRTRKLAVAPLLLKVGLTNRVDLQLGLEPTTRQTVTDPAGGGSRETVQGFGDTLLRLKVNVFGNDDDGPAFGLMPYIKLPTADDALGNGDVEGGIILPFAASLPGGFDLGAMAQLDFRRTDDNQSDTIDLVHTITLGHELMLGLAGYVEYAGFASLDDAEPYRAYFDSGLTLAITGDVQLDGGVRIGLTQAADDVGFFLGLSIRF